MAGTCQDHTDHEHGLFCDFNPLFSRQVNHFRTHVKHQLGDGFSGNIRMGHVTVIVDLFQTNQVFVQLLLEELELAVYSLFIGG